VPLHPVENMACCYGIDVSSPLSPPNSRPGFNRSYRQERNAVLGQVARYFEKPRCAGLLHIQLNERACVQIVERQI